MLYLIARRPAGRRSAGSFGGFGNQPGAGFHGRLPSSGVDLNIVAATLQITADRLRGELAAGTTLTEVISQHGATVDQVVDALVAPSRRQLAAQVAAGQISAAQEQQLLASDRSRLRAAIASNAV